MDPSIRPMSYVSLKYVIPYLDPNFRIQNAAKLPTLQSVFKSTPLRIDTLKLDETSFTVNDYKYYFGSFFTDPSNQGLTERMITGNQSGGVPWDVDKFGNEDQDPTLAPGDLLIERHMDRREQRLARHPNEIDIAAEDFVAPDPNQEYTSHTKFSLFHIQGRQDILKTSASFPEGVKVRDAVRKLLVHYFGGHRVHFVNHLEIEAEEGVLRVPEGMKLACQHLIVVKPNGNMMIQGVRPIIKESCFPLNSITIGIEIANDTVFQNEVLLASPVLYIRDFPDNQLFPLVLTDLPNKNIHLTKRGLSLADFVVIARDWVQQPREIGTVFSMKATIGNQLLEWVETDLNARKAGNPDFGLRYLHHGLVVPVNETAELHIFGIVPANHTPGLLMNPWPYTFVMQVVPAGSTRLWEE